ncbi:MAG: FHA domain-containing protein [Phycisphaerae bacterium]|nr:FHA domain-containing protein [Phycisphaerae bacterium]
MARDKDEQKEPELIDDLDLLGPIEVSGVTNEGRRNISGDRTDIAGYPERTNTGEISSERTTIIDAFALTGRRPILTVTAGPDAGKDVTIDKEVFEIGRGTVNDYVLHDLAVSRKHIRLASRGETYSLFDMGSGNGTRVNGVRVTELVLHDGDEIAIGNTVMRFEWPLEASVTGAGEKTQIFAPISQIKKVKEVKVSNMQKALPWLLYGGGGLVIMAVIIIVVMVAVNRLGGEKETESEGLDIVVQRNITAGIADFNSGHFSEAFKKFDVSLNLDPSNQMATEYKTKSEKEIENEKSYQNAQKLIAERNFEEAAKELKKIPAESYFASRLAPLKDRLASVASAKIDEAEDLIERGQYTRAKRYLQTVKEIDPENTKADQLLKKIEESEKATAQAPSSSGKPGRQRGEEKKKAQRERDPWEEESAPPPREKKPKRERESSPPPSSGGKGLAKYTNIYKGGNISQAIDMLSASDEANTAGGKDLLKKMRSFQIMYMQGKNQYNSGNSVQAKKFLEKARQLDREIAKGSKYANEIANMLRSL